MTKLIRTAYILIGIIVLSIFVPELYWKVFEKNIRAPFPIYSPVSKDFIFMRFNEKKIVRTDSKGNLLKEDEYTSLAPIFFFRQLSMDGKLPDSLWGKELNPSVIKRNSLNIKISSKHILNPQIQLFPLFESKSGKVKLEMPQDFFRINNRMEFINCEKNEINENKSSDFSNALTEKGFSYPAKNIFGNPTNRKPFDEGYFITDSDNKFYHLKMEKGKPVVSKIDVPEGINIVFMKVYEHPSREFYGVVITEESDVYLLNYDNYKLVQMPVQNYDYEKDALLFRRTLLFKTLVVQKSNSIEAVAVDHKNDLLDSYNEKWDDKYETTAGKIYSSIFPFCTQVFNKFSNFADFSFKINKGYFLIPVNFVALLFYLLISRIRRKEQFDFSEILIVGLTGIYGLLTVLLFKRENA